MAALPSPSSSSPRAPTLIVYIHSTTEVVCEKGEFDLIELMSCTSNKSLGVPSVIMQRVVHGAGKSARCLRPFSSHPCRKEHLDLVIGWPRPESPTLKPLR